MIKNIAGFETFWTVDIIIINNKINVCEMKKVLLKKLNRLHFSDYCDKLIR